MKQLIFTYLILCTALLISSNSWSYNAPKANQAPIIDGLDDDDAWTKAPWKNIDQLTLGEQPSATDFQGRFKVVWTSYRIYLLAEITDDVIYDAHPDPLDHYWDDDALEIFIDEDRSGGNHQFNYNAFAYHVAIDNQSVDIGPPLGGSSEVNFRTYNDHVTSQWKRKAGSPNTLIWELAIKIFPNTYKDSYDKNEKPVQALRLNAGKTLGFMVAYCDNDGSESREHFIGSENIAPVNGDKNRGFIDASVFGSLTLVK